MEIYKITAQDSEGIFKTNSYIQNIEIFKGNEVL